MSRIQKWFTSKVSSQSGGIKSIYGPDNRKDIYALDTEPASAKQKQWAASTCVLTSRNRLTKTATGYELKLEDFRPGGNPPCPDERFAKQKTGGWCSGFLVAPDIVATAGHCCESGRDEDATEISFVFQFHAQDEQSSRSIFDENCVYFGKQVVAHDLSSSGDFALIRLDRPVAAPGAAPLKVRSDGEPALSTRIGLIGHPSGLPTKSAFRAIIGGKDSVWLFTNLDSFGGNSGSAVFNEESGEIEGILVRGRSDYETLQISTGPCCKSRRYPESDAGEAVTRASVFAAKIPH